MAKQNILMSCGHWHTLQFFGPGRERERKAEWAKREGLCRDCFLDRKYGRTNQKTVIDPHIAHSDTLLDSPVAED